MSRITQTDILHIAELAKIHIEETESETISQKLSNILDLVERMQSIDTENIEPLAHAIYQNQKLRNDIAVTDNQRDYYQRLGQATEDGFYLVPKVID